MLPSFDSPEHPQCLNTPVIWQRPQEQKTLDKTCCRKTGLVLNSFTLKRFDFWTSANLTCWAGQMFQCEWRKSLLFKRQGWELAIVRQCRLPSRRNSAAKAVQITSWAEKINNPGIWFRITLSEITLCVMTVGNHTACEDCQKSYWLLRLSEITLGVKTVRNHAEC